MFRVKGITKFNRLRISWIGLALSIIYFIWAFYLLSIAMQDGLKCGVPGGSIISICGDSLLFILATLPTYFVASFLGITPSYSSLSQWIVYIGLCLILVYFLGYFIQKTIDCFINIHKHKKPYSDPK